MLADIRILLLPYATGEDDSLLHLLIQEFKSNQWTHFRSAIAFAKQSANYQDLLNAMIDFAKCDCSIEMTFGADLFGGAAKGTEYEALKKLISKLNEFPKVKFFLYHEYNRTFHPKLYLFSNENDGSGLLIVGSSNWSHGGLVDNVEANVIVKLDLDDPEHRTCYDEILEYFKIYWQEIE